MPLMKQKGYKYSILCDVFLLFVLQLENHMTNIILLNLPIASGLESGRNESFQPPTIPSIPPFPLLTPPSQKSQQLQDSKIFFTTFNFTNGAAAAAAAAIINDNRAAIEKEKFTEKLDAYKDFSNAEIHRILRDEDTIYYDDDTTKRILQRQRWKKSISSKNIFNKRYIQKYQKRSIIINDDVDVDVDDDDDDDNVNNEGVNLYFDNENNNFNNNNNNITESRENSTKIVLDLVNRNLTEIDVYRILKEQKQKDLKILQQQQQQQLGQQQNTTTQSNLNEIILVNLTNNHLNNFQIENIVELTNLRYLDLTKNNLSNFIINNSTIKILNLAKNHVSNFTSTTKNSNLRKLILRNNNVKTVKNLNLTELRGLLYLDLSCNRIVEMEANVFRQVKKLKRLNLSKNQLRRIRKELFYNLLNIDTLILSENNISTIDLDTFVDLPNLQHLDLSYNRIRSDSVRALQGIPDLVSLSIAYNPDLGDSLQEFVSSWSLKELDASGTNLCKIPAALAQSVRALKLVDNWFSVIRCGDLDSYPLLQYLDLSFCDINEIEEDALGRLEVLEILFLDHNNLRRVPISLPTSLEHLFLQNNQIMDIQPHTFQTLMNLKTLDLSGNKLIYLPDLPLPKLQVLNLQSSELKGLSQSIVKTSPNLRDLLLDGNPIKCSDLLGIAEWASPCQNERIIIQEKDIKGRFQRMHNHFENIQSNQNYESDCNFQKEDFNSNKDVIFDRDEKRKRRPKCADSNIKFIQSNRLESQLQGFNDAEFTASSLKTLSNENLLNLLSSFLQQSNGIFGKRNATILNSILDKGNVLLDQQHKNQGSANETSSVDGMDKLSKINENEIAVVNRANKSEQDAKMNLNGQFSQNNPVQHINEKTLLLQNEQGSQKQQQQQQPKKLNEAAKTPFLSFLYNSTENITKHTSSNGISSSTSYHSGTWRSTSKNITQEPHHEEILSKIKSDNNYVETSVLLSQEDSSDADDGINREGKKFIVQLGNHDPADNSSNNNNSNSGNFKSKNIDSVPKVKENILFDEKHHIQGKLMEANSLHKIDGDNMDKFEAPAATTAAVVSNDGQKEKTMYVTVQAKNNISNVKIPPISKNIFPSAKRQQLTEDSVKKGNLSNSLSPSKRLASTDDSPLATDNDATVAATTILVSDQDYITKNWGDEQGTPPIVPPSSPPLLPPSGTVINSTSKTKINLFKDNIVSQSGTTINTTTTTLMLPLMRTTRTKTRMRTTTTTKSSISADDIFQKLTTKATIGPLVTLSQNMMTSKVNKADSVVFFDQPNVMDENGIIKWKQNVSQPLGQHYKQIQKVLLSKQSNHRQNSQMLATNLGEKKVQRRLKLTSPTASDSDSTIPSSVQDNRSNKDSQQKPRNPVRTKLNIERILDGNHESRPDEIGSNVKTVDRSSSSSGSNNNNNSSRNSTNNLKGIVTASEKFSSLKQQKKDTEIQDNLSNQNQIQKSTRYEETFEARKIEQILGKGSISSINNNRIMNAAKLQDTLQLGNEYGNNNFHKLLPLKKNRIPSLEQKKKIYHTLNIPKDTVNSPFYQDLTVTKTTETTILQPILNENIRKSEQHHTINTDNLQHTAADYIIPRVLPIPTKDIKFQSQDFSYTNGKPTSLDPIENYLNVNKDFNSPDRSRISNSKIESSEISDGTDVMLVNHHYQHPYNHGEELQQLQEHHHHHHKQEQQNIQTQTSSNGNSSSGLPPEQLLDIRTTSGHPGLFIVIGVTFGMLLALGLIHIYRCRRPWTYVYHGPQFHNPNHPHHQHHHHQHHHQHQHSNHQHPNLNHNSPMDSSDYCNCDDDYYIEFDQESHSSAQKDFLPMELLNSNSISPLQQSPQHLQEW